MIGANAEVIAKAEDRELFKRAMLKIGLDIPRGQTVRSLDEAREAIKQEIMSAAETMRIDGTITMRWPYLLATGRIP